MTEERFNVKGKTRWEVANSIACNRISKNIIKSRFKWQIEITESGKMTESINPRVLRPSETIEHDDFMDFEYSDDYEEFYDGRRTIYKVTIKHFWNKDQLQLQIDSNRMATGLHVFVSVHLYHQEALHHCLHPVKMMEMAQKDRQTMVTVQKTNQDLIIALFLITSGILKVKNHKYELVAAGNQSEPNQQLIGQMKSKELLIKNLEEQGFQDIEIGKDESIRI